MAGQLGGYVETEDNLSQEGEAWIHDHACVYDQAEIFEEAQIYGQAQIFGRAQVYGRAQVSGEVQISEKAHVYGNTNVYDHVQVQGYARIFGEACIRDHAKVYGNAWVYGGAHLANHVHVYDDAKIAGNVVATRAFPSLWQSQPQRSHGHQRRGANIKLKDSLSEPRQSYFLLRNSPNETQIFSFKFLNPHPVWLHTEELYSAEKSPSKSISPLHAATSAMCRTQLHNRRCADCRFAQ